MLQGFLALTKKHPSETLEKACETAHSHGEYRLRSVRRLIAHQSARQERFEFAADHPLIRPLADYGAFLRGVSRLDGARIKKAMFVGNAAALVVTVIGALLVLALLTFLAFA